MYKSESTNKYFQKSTKQMGHKEVKDTAAQVYVREDLNGEETVGTFYKYKLRLNLQKVR